MCVGSRTHTLIATGKAREKNRGCVGEPPSKVCALVLVATENAARSWPHSDEPGVLFALKLFQHRAQESESEFVWGGSFFFCYCFYFWLPLDWLCCVPFEIFSSGPARMLGLGIKL